MTASPWCLSWRADPAGAAIADRHYSRRTPGSGQFAPPGRVLILRRPDALWVTLWPQAKYVLHAWPGAWTCTLFRNEGSLLSSGLITAAVAATRWKWSQPPSEGMVTFVDVRKVRHKRDPGRCFRRAGFRPVGYTADQHLLVLQLAPDRMPVPLPPRGAPDPLLFTEAAS